MNTKYKEKLKELLVDDSEFELLENRKILDKINFDRTVVDPDGDVKVLDISQGILIFCKNCESLQPVSVKCYWSPELWFYCDECGRSHHDVVLHLNKKRRGDRDYKVN